MQSTKNSIVYSLRKLVKWKFIRLIISVWRQFNWMHMKLLFLLYDKNYNFDFMKIFDILTNKWDFGS